MMRRGFTRSTLREVGGYNIYIYRYIYIYTYSAY